MFININFFSFYSKKNKTGFYVAPVYGRFLHAVMVAASIFLLTGCQTSSPHEPWPQGMTLTPDLQRFKNATIQAATEKRVWVPLAGAAVMSLGSLDEDVVDWASDHHPIFGSQQNAHRASDGMRSGMEFIAIGTALATPGSDEPVQWVFDKSKGLGGEFVIYSINSSLTDNLKRMSGEDGPDGSKDDAFPSAHTVDTFTAATLSERHIRAMDVKESTQKWTTVGLDSSAYLLGWARLEADAHYPSDVLFGAAMANFLTAVLYDTFIEEDSSLAVQVSPLKNGMMVSVQKKI